MHKARQKDHAVTTSGSAAPGAGGDKGSLVIQNIVASVAWDGEVDLDAISAAFRDVEAKDNFPGLVLRLTNPKATILLFKSGRLVLTGVKHRQDVAVAVDKVFKRLQGIGIPVPANPEVVIQNVVASGDLGKRVDLDAASMVLERAIYEPEVFPGLIYRTAAPDPKACFLIFSSGKIVCTGMKQEADLIPAVKKMAASLKNNGLLIDIIPMRSKGKQRGIASVVPGN